MSTTLTGPLYPRLCTACEHFGAYNRCRRPLTDRIDLVDGRPADRLEAFASDERLTARPTLFTRRPRCGPAGQFFKQRRR